MWVLNVLISCISEFCDYVQCWGLLLCVVLIVLILCNTECCDYVLCWVLWLCAVLSVLIMCSADCCDYVFCWVVWLCELLIVLIVCCSGCCDYLLFWVLWLCAVLSVVIMCCADSCDYVHYWVFWLCSADCCDYVLSWMFLLYAVLSVVIMCSADCCYYVQCSALSIGFECVVILPQPSCIIFHCVFRKNSLDFFRTIMWDWHTRKPPPTQKNKTQESVFLHTCVMRAFNPLFQSMVWIFLLFITATTQQQPVIICQQPSCNTQPINIQQVMKPSHPGFVYSPSKY